MTRLSKETWCLTMGLCIGQEQSARGSVRWRVWLCSVEPSNVVITLSSFQSRRLLVICLQDHWSKSTTSSHRQVQCQSKFLTLLKSLLGSSVPSRKSPKGLWCFFLDDRCILVILRFFNSLPRTFRLERHVKMKRAAVQSESCTESYLRCNATQWHTCV